jgi:hypothetical protein
MGLAPEPAKIPAPPKVFPIDIPSAMTAAANATQFGYDLSDSDFTSRFPGLVSTQQADIAQATKDLTTVDPVTESEFVKRGAGQAFGAFGSGSEGPINLNTGSIGRNTLATSVAGQTRQFQDNARGYLESLFASNPERQFVSGADAANIAIQNNAILNQANQNAYLAKVQQDNANQAASNAGTQAAIGLGESVLSAL